MPRKVSDLHISPEEFAKKAGVSASTIRNQMRQGAFPLGYAAKMKGGGWCYHIPRKPAEEYLRTGRLPA